MFRGTYGYEIRKPIHDALKLIQDYINSENLTIECNTNQYSTWESNNKVIPSYRYLITDDLARHIDKTKKHQICNVISDAYYNDDDFKCFVMSGAYAFIKPICDERYVTIAELDASHEPTGVTYEFSSLLDAKNMLSYTPEDCLLHIGNFVGISSIGMNEFKDCDNLYDVEFSDIINHVGEDAFEGTKWLTRKRNTDVLVVVNDILIDGKAAIGEKMIPSKIRIIADAAFKNNTSITAIRRNPNSVVENIGTDAFYGCTNLLSVSLPDTTYIIDSRAFSGCGLVGVTIPGRTRYIGIDAFKNCLFLEFVEILNGALYIANGAFYNCDRLETINIPVSIETIGTDAFYRELGGIHQYISIDKPKDSIEGAPWGAVNYTITWR